jgi:hypothetical protein
MVAEKPSVAAALARILSRGSHRTRINADGWAPMCKIHQVNGIASPAPSASPLSHTWLNSGFRGERYGQGISDGRSHSSSKVSKGSR